MITVRKRDKKGRPFITQDVNEKLYLRYACFQKRDVSALVSSKHSKEKLKTLLAKPKDLWIFHCCGFKVIDSYFNPGKFTKPMGHTINIVKTEKNGKTIVLAIVEKLTNYLRCISLIEINVRIGLMK